VSVCLLVSTLLLGNVVVVVCCCLLMLGCRPCEDELGRLSSVTSIRCSSAKVLP